MRVRRSLFLAVCGVAALVWVDGAGARQAVERAAPPAIGQDSLPAQVAVCFVPAQKCDAGIVAAIESARHTIRVQAYGFTAAPILTALAAAKARGVDVAVILDKSNDPEVRHGGHRTTSARALNSGAPFTAAAGIPTWIDHTVAIAHNKVIVIDGHLVIGGSYNYTASAEHRNAENVTFIDSQDIAALYLTNWDGRRAVSRLYEPPSADNARAVAASALSDR